MSENFSPFDFASMPFSDAFKKLKRFRFFEPSFGILGFSFLTLFVLCCFFYLHYKALARGFRFSSPTERLLWLKLDGYANHPKVDFLEERRDGCDLFDGNWVWDESYPLYKSEDCPFMDQGFRCSENGRSDLFYTKWRWQPRYCNLPRFNATQMLAQMRNKRLVFVGDSIGRNQWESLLCMLSSAVQDKKSIYEANGRPITKHKGFFVFKFKDYNCTVEYYRAPFLVLQSRPPDGTPQKIKQTVKIDRMDWNSVKWKDADILVLNSGHWWNYEKTKRGGCYFQEGDQVKMEMTEENALRRSMETVLDWVEHEVNTSKTQVLFRTFAPVHFRGGSWRSGGHCHLEKLPDLGFSLVPPENWARFHTIADILSSAQTNSSGLPGLTILNITSMTARRKDGHSSLYYRGPKLGPASVHRQDCSHWCLPGVPDSWNELLYALFLKRETAAHTWNSSQL